MSNSIDDAEHAVKTDTALKEEYASQIAETVFSIDEFLKALKCQQRGTGIEMALDTKEHTQLMSSVKLMSQDLKTVQTRLESFWLNHKAQLDHMVHMCHFNERTDKVYVATHLAGILSRHYVIIS